jgi:hypothetical protein
VSVCAGASEHFAEIIQPLHHRFTPNVTVGHASGRVSTSRPPFGFAKCRTNRVLLVTPNFRYAFVMCEVAVLTRMPNWRATSFRRTPFMTSSQISLSRDESESLGKPQPRLPFAVNLLAWIGKASMFASSMGSPAALASPQDSKLSYRTTRGIS